MKTTHELWLFYIKMALFHEASDHETREETLTLFYDVVFQSTTKYIDSKFSKRQPLFCSNDATFLLRLLKLTAHAQRPDPETASSDPDVT